MLRFLGYFKSRTVWTIALLFVVNGIEGVREQIPGGWLPVVDAVLSLAAIYFRVNVKAKL